MYATLTWHILNLSHMYMCGMEYASLFKTGNVVDFFSTQAYYVYMQHMTISFGATSICLLGQNLQQVLGL
jgi:hypothetical protein